MNKYMEQAFKEALKAYRKKEVPVGAVIVYNGKIIAKSHNNRQNRHNVLGHAEIMAVLKAEKKIRDWRLDECEMFVTLEPCTLCTHVIKECRLKKVYFLLKSPQETTINGFTQTNDCEELQNKYKCLLQKFFQKLR